MQIKYFKSIHETCKRTSTKYNNAMGLCGISERITMKSECKQRTFFSDHVHLYCRTGVKYSLKIVDRA